MKKVMMIVVMVAAVALPAMAGWITGAHHDATKTQEAFQSTSTLQGSGSTYTSNPVLNADGTAATPTETASGPRRAKKDEGDDDITIVTPGASGSQAPIGDAVLPLMLMAVAFGGVVSLISTPCTR